MKINFQRILLYVISILFIIASSSCKKEPDPQGEDNPKELPTKINPPKIEPTTPGFIIANVTELTIKIGSAFEISAKAYSSTGVLKQPQPGMNWSTQNESVATISNGLVNGVAEGKTQITVTDNVHGYAYVNVTVVKTDSIISKEPVSILFDQPLILLRANETVSLNYNVYAIDGTISSVIPVLYSAASSDQLLISNNTLTAGSKAGVFTIEAKYNEKNLSGSLLVYIQIESAPPQAQTDWIVSEINLTKVPTSIFSFNLPSDPIRIRVVEYRPGPLTFTDPHPGLRVYETSPEYIVIEDPTVIAGNSQGNLVARSPGYTKVTAGYRNKELSWLIYVPFDFNAKWTGLVAGEEVSFCLSSKRKGIEYNKFVELIPYNTYGQWDFGIYSFKGCSGDVSASDLDLRIGVQPNTCFSNSVLINGSYETAFKLINRSDYRVSNDEIKAVYTQNGKQTEFRLFRTSGVCNSKGLKETLIGDGNSIWRANECINEIWAWDYITFKFSENTVIYSDGEDNRTVRYRIEECENQLNTLFFEARNDPGYYVSWLSVVRFNNDTVFFSNNVCDWDDDETIPCDLYLVR
jgi:hypothetical protein